MKKLTITLILLSVFINVWSQNKYWRGAIGLAGGTTQYSGEMARDFYKFNTINPFGGLTYAHYLSPRADLAASALFGGWGYEREDYYGFSTGLTHVSAQLRIKLLNNPAPKAMPYVFLGLGVHNWTDYALEDADGNDLLGNDLAGEKEDLEGLHGVIPFGAGVQFRLTDRLFLNVQETFMYSGDDAWDNRQGDLSDQMLMHTVGLSFGLCPWGDEDGDGVGNDDDKCPKTPSIAKVDEFGCPIDSDKDGIPDHEDNCPFVAGVASGKGCPDRDGDTILDDVDSCPDVAGLSSMAGCPDKDGDGITDADDACPNEKGLKEFGGCPDSDGDGIQDKDDECPKVKGIKSMKGCPDKDGDGITDADDKCPDIAGVKENKGCPEIKEEVKQIFQQALQGIQFETGKDVIKPTSFEILDNVVKIMLENPAYKLKINGHTDNVGDPVKNLDLSNRRANAVMKYLTDHGVQAGRLSAAGFGDTQPVAPNDTKEGKAKNRRVEFVVEF